MKTPPEKWVSDLNKASLEAPLTLEELGNALKTTKNQRSPGLDGIPADFLKVFYSRIKQLLLDMFNECFKLSCIFPSGRRGLISLIPKKSRDLRYITNWRPIILLCADYKLLSKIISNRINNELNIIINEDQSGFLKGRNIANNIRKVSDTLEFCNQRQINALLISIDFEKAFNTVEYSSLWKAVEYLNFGSNIIAWSKLLYNDFALCITNNGHLSNFFIPSRGLFQGNPYSSYGFLIIIELLATMV